jgi:hypothetical protein
MSEKFPSHNEEPENPSRRGFLKKLGAIGAAAIGAGLVGKMVSDPEREEKKTPERNTETLSKNELEKTIVENEVRIVQLRRIASEGAAVIGEDNPSNALLEDFLRPYWTAGTVPDSTTVEQEIARLVQENDELRVHRDSLP